MLQENQARDTSCLLAGSVTTCNTDYTTFMGTNSPTDYNTMVSDCQAAVSDLGPANTLLGNSNGASSAASSLSALQTALGDLPSQQVSISEYVAPDGPLRLWHARQKVLRQQRWRLVSCQLAEQAADIAGHLPSQRGALMFHSPVGC